MALTKKNGKTVCAPQAKTQIETLRLQLGHYIKEAECLQNAYHFLQKQFYELKEKWEASRLTLEQLTTSMSDGMMFVSLEGIISLYNPAAAELIGFTLEAVLHKPYQACFSDSLFGFSMQEALSQKEIHQRVFLRLNEKEIEISTSSVPEKGILIFMFNRTEHQKLQKSLTHAERLQELGEMAATLAHEIRNPLGAVAGFASLLQRDITAPSHQKMISAILEGTSSLNALVTQVLDYAKPMRLHFEPLNLTQLVQEVCTASQTSHPTTHYCFHSALMEYVVLLDKTQIKHVLNNILYNAAESGATVVDITLTDQGTLTIKDNGSGMDHKTLQKIFTPFFTTKAKGTGLGLAASLSVIKAHGGTLEVSSEEGKGTQFTLSLGSYAH